MNAISQYNILCKQTKNKMSCVHDMGVLGIKFYKHDLKGNHPVIVEEGLKVVLGASKTSDFVCADREGLNCVPAFVACGLSW